MDESDSPVKPQTTMNAIPTIPQLALKSKENLKSISYSQRPKTPMRTYVVSSLLVSAMCIPLGFGIFLMFHPDRTEYSADSLEGTPSVENDQVLISGVKKVIPMHNAPRGHNPTFGVPRAIQFNPATQAPLSKNVPAPLINQANPTPAQQYIPAAPQPSILTPHTAFNHAVSTMPGAASAAVPFAPTAVPAPSQMPLFDAPQQSTAAANTYNVLPQYQNQQQIPAYPVYTPTQSYRAGRDSRLQMVTTR